MNGARRVYGASLVLLGVGIVAASVYVAGLLVTAVGPVSRWDYAAAFCFGSGLAAGGSAAVAGTRQILSQTRDAR